VFCCFFFSSRRRHTRFSRDWSSDVCSSDLIMTLFQEHFSAPGTDATAGGGADVKDGFALGSDFLVKSSVAVVGLRIPVGEGGDEIGRASCRERVGISVLTLAAQQEKRTA